jgi:hypothetical protein
MRAPFKNLLAEFVRHAASGDHPPSLFREGDAAHLNRWLDDDRADEIFRKICGEQFHYNRAYALVMVAIRSRLVAESADLLNKETNAIQRRGKDLIPKELGRAAKMFLNDEMSPEDLAAIKASTKEAMQPILGPKLRVRSDKNGSRKRTIFCRTLADFIHHATGRWHDAEVAALCEIAFDCEDVTEEMARSAREAGRREATRNKRS